jgi:ABC-type bacteriocin/lantibiotic exporter with double-glycine peptidase domain
MVLAGLGHDIGEGELRALCDCNAFGTDALKAVDAARLLGFTGTAKHTLPADELAALTGRGSYPIVFVNTLPIDGVKGTHAFVVLEVGGAAVVVCDPLLGERTLPRATFDTARAMMHDLAILVEK